jgi:predicted unusual protein kinase regulating ubiquinone biosynthesis (AarF/ABC1/UbiB family)
MVNDSETHSYFEHINEYVSRICELARTYYVKLDPQYFNIAMALKIVEGISLTLNKDLDMISTCVPIVVKAKTYRKLGIDKFPVTDDEAMTKYFEDAAKSNAASDAQKR